MKKIIVQGLILTIAFFGLWYVLHLVDWKTVLRIEKITQKTDKKLGDLVWDFYKKSHTIIDHDDVVKPIDSLIRAICTANEIDPSKIKLHVVKNEEINAFALPDHHLIINSGLIEASKNESALSGVIVHEIAHMELRHVMKKLVKELGISAVLSISTGGAGSEMIKEVVKLISSSAYDRKLETEADLKGVDYLINAGIDPFPFADFMETIAEKEKDNPSYFQWISTHPESIERAKNIRKHAKTEGKKYQAILHPETWQILIQTLKDQ